MRVQLPNGRFVSFSNSLMFACDSLVYNITKDWDFVIIVSGNRMVRVGKSKLAFQVAAYMAYRLGTKFDCSNIFFDSEDMIRKAQEMPKYSVIVYDEGREGLDKTNASKVSKDLIQFFTECGQLNHIFIVVLPDYFVLKEEIAVGRSEFLINVYRHSQHKEPFDVYGDGVLRPITEYHRGFFTMFSREKKEKLYDLMQSTRRKNYQAVKTILGNYADEWAIDEDEYREMKKKALARFNEKREIGKATKVNKLTKKIIIDLTNQGHSSREVVELLKEQYDFEIGHTTISAIVKENLVNQAQA